MDILKGLLAINGIDPYVEYGAFLAWREGEDPLANYSALLAPPELKEQFKVEYDEDDGIRLPTKLLQRWKEREVSLTFAIIAKDKAEFEQRYYGFLAFLKEGADGWLDVTLPELSRTWRMYMRRVSPYSQLEGFEGAVTAMFTVVFEEPSPNF